MTCSGDTYCQEDADGGSTGVGPRCGRMTGEGCPRPRTPTADELFEALKHGSGDHRAWLREGIDALYAGKPVPPPRQ